METSATTPFEGELDYEVLPSLILSATTGRPWSDRFVDLLALKKGWIAETADEDQGEVVPPEALFMAHSIMDLCEMRSWALPGVYPMEEGGVQLEWASGKWVANIEITLKHSPVPDDEPSINLDMFDLESVQDRLGVFYDHADIPTLEKFLAAIGNRTP